jgi:hypothetical protein
MKLTVLERIALLNILPAEGDFVTLKIVRNLKMDLSFSEDEIKALKVEQKGAQITWDLTKETPGGKEIKIGEKATDVIVAALKKLNAEKKLIEQQFTIYEKFVKE